MNKKLSFAIDDVHLIKEDPNSSFSILSLDFFADGKNLHNLVVSNETLLRTEETIKNCPIVWKYDARFQDATTHSSEEIPCGVVPESSEISNRKLEDGRTMLSTWAIVWKRYSGKILEFFKRDGEKPVSVELTVLDSKENADGTEELLDYKFEAITVLGNLTKPAIPLAHATVLQFAAEYQEAYAREFSNKYADIDFTIPKKIKTNAQKSLDAYREKGMNANSVHLAMARFLTKNEKATPQKIRSMAQFFNRKVQYDDITMGFYGHKEGLKWSGEIMSKIDEIDNKQLSYFGEDEVVTFPYKSRSEMNPALKGISPPITSEQGSQIARVAERIGVNEEKNGWAIAISQFKKTHHVEDGRWVKNKTEKEESFVEDELDKKVEMAEEKLPESENKPDEVDMAEKKDEEKEETPKEEEKETPAEEKKEEEKEEKQEAKMSLDENLDMAAYLGFLENATEVSEEMAAKYKGTDGTLNHEAIHKMAYDKMCKMAEDLKKAQEDKDVYMSELDNLKKFKKDTEDKQFACELESTFAEVADVLPKEEVTKFREESVNYSIETLAELQNKIKAVAFSYTGKSKKAEDGITRFATSWVNQKSDKDYSNGWVGKA